MPADPCPRGVVAAADVSLRDTGLEGWPWPGALEQRGEAEDRAHRTLTGPASGPHHEMGC